MSNLSATAGSSNTSSGRRFVTGIPKNSWCGASVSARTSKSDNNPGRRYHRCSYAQSMKLGDDKHIFQWMDDGMLSEIERIGQKMVELESVCLEQQRIQVEQMQLKIEKKTCGES